MATRYYSFAEGEFYHIYNRGNSKQIIFRSETDYTRFKEILYIANSTESFKLRNLETVNVFDTERKDMLVHIGAYCLMPNHFHLLVTPARENGVPQFMLKLATSYASYFNKKYDRTGALFEGSYKAKYADSDRYLKYLFSYIHLNPFRGKDGHSQKYINLNRLHEYPYSSLPEYLGYQREENKIIAPEKFPKYFKSIGDHKRELIEWLEFQEI